jgi:predicted TIM-barrel fold metal-dependent hydrolase
MGQLPFSNVHTHVFNSECAPDNFLRILPIFIVRRMPKVIKRLLASRNAHILIHLYSRIASRKHTNKRSNFDKIVSFLDIAQQRRQLDVFELAYEAGRQFDSRIRIVGLTMNMDYMDNRISYRQISYSAQLEGVKDIKRYYPANFFPFLGIDPRHKSGSDLVRWARSYFETGLKRDDVVYPYFSGIKLYPALGFFPFDPRLADLYAYAQTNQLPVITHVTRVGSQYIGNRITDLIPESPAMLLPVPAVAAVDEAKRSIEARIAAYYKKEWIQNSDTGDNDYACDLFSHPENYIPVLETFPQLKICLAHMGGSNEIAKPRDKKAERMLRKIREVDNRLWFDRIRELMVHYPNIYTDISYTVSELDRPEILTKVNAFFETTDNYGNPLSKRVLFGTDFFMTEQEKCESDLYKLAGEYLKDYFDAITRVNPQEFLKQPV